MTSPETIATLALMERRDLPWNRLAGAIEEEGSAVRLLQQFESKGQATLFEGPGEMDNARLGTQIAQWVSSGITIVTVLDQNYPANLRTVHDRPPVLFARGTMAARDERSIAVVGTRQASQRGLAEAAAIATDLVDAGYVVVSGLAAGIDTASHNAALRAGGRTVAVIGTGLDVAFPKSNAALQERLAREHLVLSQFLPDLGPRRWTFPQRNAVMSGFARATVVVEASHTSGARMQARLALEHGRPVFLHSALLSHPWARNYADRPGVYVISSGQEVVSHVERLYTEEFTLTG